jgi:AcrR family transcriptional regulator
VTFVLWERRSDHPILDVSFFRNPRFTAASLAVTLVFFAMFGALFFISQFLQFVLGYSAFQSGLRLLPVAGALMVAAPLSAQLVARAGTKVVVTTGLVLVAGALVLFSSVSDSGSYGLIALVLVIIGVGMGLAMAPATESIMGSLPPEKAGVGSAMNDTTREIGGALGVAILGSITAAVYTSRITADPRFAALVQQAPQATGAVEDSIGGAALTAEQLPPQLAQAITAAANQAYIHAVDRTVLVGAAVALLGALVALLFLPARSEIPIDDEDLADAVTTAARRVGADLVPRRDVAAAALGVLADAGMSSLTFSGIAARAGISTATLERYWGSRVDAVVDAIQLMYEEHPVPDTGDIRRDLMGYLGAVAQVVARPQTRAVFGSLIAEAGRDEDLSQALQERLVRPRQRELSARLDRAIERGETRLTTSIPVACTQLVGPVYFRALVSLDPVDDELLRAVVDGVLVAAEV